MMSSLEDQFAFSTKDIAKERKTLLNLGIVDEEFRQFQESYREIPEEAQLRIAFMTLKLRNEIVAKRKNANFGPVAAAILVRKLAVKGII